MPLVTVDQGLFGQTTTSTTSNSISGGLKTFVLDWDDNTIQTDYTVQIISQADPDCYMYGVVTAKSSPSITVSIFKYSAVTGTFTGWDVQVIAGPFAGLPATQTLGISTDSAAVPAVGDVLSWTTDIGKAFYDNSTVYVSSIVDRTAYFFATVVSYNSGTGAIKLVVNRVSGSGTLALWSISLIDVTASFRTTVGNSNYTIKPSDNVIAQTVNLTAPRTWTVPLANSVAPGNIKLVVDETGTVNNTNYLLFARSGSDLINTALSETLSTPSIITFLVSDGVSNWNLDTSSDGRFLGDLYAARDLDVEGDTNIVGDTSLLGTLFVGGAADFTGNINSRDPDSFVLGPASSTANAVPRFSGTGGVTIKDTGVVVDNSNNVSGVGTLGCGAITSTGALVVGGAVTGVTNLTASNSDSDYSLSKISAASLQTTKHATMADDAAVNITLPGNNCAMIVYSCTTTSPGATAPSGIVFIKHDAAVAPVSIACSDSTNVVFGTVTLTTGTSNGTDGKLNFNCTGDGKIYIKNRLGATRGYSYTVINYG